MIWLSGRQSKLLRGFFHVGREDSGWHDERVIDKVVRDLEADLIHDDDIDTQVNEAAHETRYLD